MKSNEEAASAASLLGKLRWKGKSKTERATFMKQVRAQRSNAPGGRNGGRPRMSDRCYCGQNSRTRAEARRFDCCKRAGQYPTGKPERKDAHDASTRRG